MFSTESIMAELIAQGYIALFFIAVFEGPLITLLGGFFSSMGVFNIYIAYIVILLADTLGDIIAYMIGYMGRNKLAVRILGWFKIEEDKLLGLDNFFKRHGGKSIFLSKFITGAGSWTLISAGMAKVKLRRYLKFSISAGILKTAVYLGVGYFFGNMYKVLIKWMNMASAIVIIVILLILLILITKNYFKKKFKSFSRSSPKLPKKSKRKKKK